MSIKIDIEAIAEATEVYTRMIKACGGDPSAMVNYFIHDLDEARKELDKIDDMHKGVDKFTTEGERYFVVVYKGVTIIIQEEK